MFNNPYLYQSAYRPGLLSRLFGGGAASAAGASANAVRSGINWSNILTNTQKSLGIINQAIPLVYQVKPMINNAKTMFKIAGAMKGDSRSSSRSARPNTENSSNYSQTVENDNKPIFYI